MIAGMAQPSTPIHDDREPRLCSRCHPPFATGPEISWGRGQPPLEPGAAVATRPEHRPRRCGDCRRDHRAWVTTDGGDRMGSASGVGSAIGNQALYRGLASGAMNVVAPLSAVLTAVLPAIVGLAGGDRLGPRDGPDSSSRYPRSDWSRCPQANRVRIISPRPAPQARSGRGWAGAYSPAAGSGCSSWT